VLRVYRGRGIQLAGSTARVICWESRPPTP